MKNMEEMILCACGCGKLRKRYGENGVEHKYISGHNDSWINNHRPWFTCPVCGKQFKKSTHRQKLCSIACRTEILRVKRPYQERQVEIQCFNCGKMFMRKASCVGQRNFCCQDCKNQWMSEEYPQRISRPIKLTRKRDNEKCVICGFNVLVEVHHIRPKREGGEDIIENLITLCPNHHTMADRRLITQENLLALIK